MAMALCLALVVPALAVTTPKMSAQTGADVSGIGTKGWYPGTYASSLSDAISTDDWWKIAKVDLDDDEVSHYLMGTNFGFAIPPDATICGIEVTFDRSSSSGIAGGDRIRDNVVMLVKNGAVDVDGDNKADKSSNWPTDDTNITYGSQFDLWGLTWTPADINSGNFGVALSVYNANNNHERTARVDI